MLAPASLPTPRTRQDLPGELAPVFRRRPTHLPFTAPAPGMIPAGRRPVAAPAPAAGTAGKFRRACRLFSRAVPDIDDPGLAVARLIVKYPAGDSEPITVATDGTSFKRYGRKAAQARRAHDGAAQGGKKIASGNTRVIAAIVVRLPFCPSPAALPALFRLRKGNGTGSQVVLAGQILTLLTGAWPDRDIHGAGDTAPHGAPPKVRGTTWTTRLPASAAASAPAPPKTGKRGRPRTKGERPGTPAQTAAGAGWHTVTVTCYGQTTTVQAATVDALWYGSFTNAPGHLVLVRDDDPARPHDPALFTLDTTASTVQVIERYSWRRPIEPSNAAGKQITGVGDACNRLEAAAEPTLPSGFPVQSLLICWYASHGYDPADISTRRILCPWYRTKTEPSLADMPAKLRREFLKARFSAIPPGHNPLDQIEDDTWTCGIPAA